MVVKRLDVPFKFLFPSQGRGYIGHTSLTMGEVEEEVRRLVTVPSGRSRFRGVEALTSPSPSPPPPGNRRRPRPTDKLRVYRV